MTKAKLHRWMKRREEAATLLRDASRKVDLMREIAGDGDNVVAETCCDDAKAKIDHALTMPRVALEVYTDRTPAEGPRTP